MYDKLILLRIKVSMAALTHFQINRFNKAIAPGFVLIKPKPGKSKNTLKEPEIKKVHKIVILIFYSMTSYF